MKTKMKMKMVLLVVKEACVRVTAEISAKAAADITWGVCWIGWHRRRPLINRVLSQN